MAKSRRSPGGSALVVAGLACVVALGAWRSCAWCASSGRRGRTAALAGRPAATLGASPQRRLVRLCAKLGEPGGGLWQEKSDAYKSAVEGYDPDGPHEFQEGTPPTGWRNITESLRPYHPRPDWMIFPTKGFERDQKICSLYTLATGLFKEINKALREDNEDSLRRHGSFIHELQEVLRFKVDTICTPEGRKCRPFIGNVSRGLNVPADMVEALANEYPVGAEFTWPGFTSCQLEEKGLWPFDGNLNFEIECAIDPKTMKVDEVYAPVRISRFLQGSNEVLFPPHTRFRVVGEAEKERVKENEEYKDVYTKYLEVIELPTPPK
eukprot:TRINITY_DN9292_c0_g1_i1.p1 TRINITY_DN9292_c0_g1~~TRINITY_DN9292_c0_g1_i1.p1  ORF type:complete len:323 (-),score=62.91 TRINITY_DN9292_c0_g1_i1:187-1155(-)